MNKTAEEGTYDIEDRTLDFARRVRAFVKRLPRTICNMEDVKQVVRSSGSIGANYIEANESLSKKDFRMRIRISRKESKETRYWLRLLETGDDSFLNDERDFLIQESGELMRIFGAILQKDGEFSRVIVIPVGGSSFGILIFEFVSNFDIRISRLGYS